MMKKYFTLLLMLFLAYSYAQLAPFTVTATKVNDETCPSNGAISWTASPKTDGSTMTYSITNAAGTVVATASQNPNSDTNTFSGLVAGTYTVTATQTLGAQSNSAKSAAIVIANQKVTLAYTVTKNSDEICGNDGQLTVNVTTGRSPYTYQLLDSSLNIVSTQTSNVFSNLTAGTYNIRVVDQCGAGVAQKITIFKTPSQVSPSTASWNYSTIFRPRQSSDCTGLIPDRFLVSYKNDINAIKLPLVTEISYVNPKTGLTETINHTFTSAITMSAGGGTTDLSLSPVPTLPYFPNSANIKFNYKFTDGCGVISQYSETLDNRLLTSAIAYKSPCGSPYLTIQGTGTIKPQKYKVTFTSFPAGFDPVAFNSQHNTFQTPDINGYVNYGSATNPMPPGDYSYTLEDSCGRTTGIYSVTLKNSSPLVYVTSGQDCANTGYIQLGAAVDFTSINITSAPATFSSIYPLPYSITPFADKRSAFLDNLPAGDYTVNYTTSCDNTVYTVNSTITAFSQNYNAAVSQTCNNFSVNITGTSNGGGMVGLQKYNIITGKWGSPIGQDYNPNSYLFIGLNNYNNAVNIGNNLTYGSGKYRVIHQRNYSVQTSSSTSTAIYCDTVIKEFIINNTLSLDNAYAFQCANGTYDVVISATGNGTLHYSIVSDGTSTATIIKDNGTSPIFHGIAAGSYYFRVMDDCGNFITRKLDMAQLGKPGVSIVSDCTTTPGSLKLVVNGVDYLKFEWRKTRDASGNAIASPPVIATTSILDLGTYDSTDAGTYTVHMYTDPAAGYCIDNSVDMSLTVDALSAAHAGTGQTVNIIYDGTTQSLNLFSYLTGQYDAFGTWTETTVPPSALLTGFNWNIAAAAPGTYTFRYTVAAPCGGATDSSYVTINLSKLCYKLPALTGGTTEDTRFGITALGRAGSNSDNWPMLRKGGWMAMEANTKGFVVNRVAFTAGNQPVGIPTANYVAGMMVYDTTNKCLKIYNGTIWSCFTTPTCPN